MPGPDQTIKQTGIGINVRAGINKPATGQTWYYRFTCKGTACTLAATVFIVCSRLQLTNQILSHGVIVLHENGQLFQAVR